MAGTPNVPSSFQSRPTGLSSIHPFPRGLPPAVSQIPCCIPPSQVPGGMPLLSSQPLGGTTSFSEAGSRPGAGQQFSSPPMYSGVPPFAGNRPSMQPPPQTVRPVSQTMMNMGGEQQPQFGLPSNPAAMSPPPPHAPHIGQQYSSYGDYGSQKMQPVQNQPPLVAPLAQPQPRRLDPDQMPSPVSP